MNWKIVILLLVILIIYKIYKFSAYIKKYLYFVNLDIVENEKVDEVYELEFAVKFAKGYFSKEYFNTYGKIRSDIFISPQMLKEILSMTEIDRFLNPELESIKKSHFEYNYEITTSIKQPRKMIIVQYQLIMDSIIDLFNNSQV